jgi:type I restriction enzyme M protein
VRGLRGLRASFAAFAATLLDRWRLAEHAWQVSAQEIAARNYNLDCKNPHWVEIDHGEPEDLMKEFLEISQEMRVVQDALKLELIQALGS